MNKAHIHLKDKHQEIKITILERKDGQPFGMDDNYSLPVSLELKGKTESFIKERIYLETYELVLFYCCLDDIAKGRLIKEGFSFVEPYITLVLENINDKILFTFYYKAIEEDKEEIIIKQKFSRKQFLELIATVHQGLHTWIEDTELIDFRDNLHITEEHLCYKTPQQYRVVEVEFNNRRRKYYLCDDKSVKAKQFVIVPNFFGKGIVAKVVGIKYFAENKLPCSLKKMRKVIKRHIPLVKKIDIHSHDVTESGFGFELLVNYVFKKATKTEFSIKDKNAYYNVYLEEYKDVYLDVYKEMLSLKPNEMKMTKGLWLTAERVLHVGSAEKKNELKDLFLNILDKAKELKKHWIGIPCLLEEYHRIQPKTAFKVALETVKRWIMVNEDYKMEVLFCCPDDKLYKKFKRYYDKKIKREILS